MKWLSVINTLVCLLIGLLSFMVVEGGGRGGSTMMGTQKSRGGGFEVGSRDGSFAQRRSRVRVQC